jgi:hypothetical protein
MRGLTQFECWARTAFAFTNSAPPWRAIRRFKSGSFKINQMRAVRAWTPIRAQRNQCSARRART